MKAAPVLFFLLSFSLQLIECSTKFTVYRRDLIGCAYYWELLVDQRRRTALFSGRKWRWAETNGNDGGKQQVSWHWPVEVQSCRSFSGACSWRCETQVQTHQQASWSTRFLLLSCWSGPPTPNPEHWKVNIWKLEVTYLWQLHSLSSLAPGVKMHWRYLHPVWRWDEVSVILDCKQEFFFDKTWIYWINISNTAATTKTNKCTLRNLN